MNYSEMTVILI